MSIYKTGEEFQKEAYKKTLKYIVNTAEGYQYNQQVQEVCKKIVRAVEVEMKRLDEVIIKKLHGRLEYVSSGAPMLIFHDTEMMTPEAVAHLNNKVSDAVALPDFQKKYKDTDWQYHVDAKIKSVWDTLSLESRLAFYFDASKSATQNSTDHTMLPSSAEKASEN
jgi:uncharacterized protein YPO0396